MTNAAASSRASPVSIVVARGSAPGRCVRAIVRASGPSLARAFRPAFVHPLPQTRCHEANRMKTAAGEIPCIVLWMPAPASFTGEDCLEALVPSNPVLLDAAVDALLASAAQQACAARHANAGEFAMRAFFNGRLELAAAEGLAAAIAATDDAELAAARMLASGALALEANAIADAAMQCLALVEVGIDFSDVEDVTAITPAALAPQLRALSLRLESISNQGAREDRASAVSRVVLFGPPNVGKSSLFNAIVGHERTVTADEIGTTRDAIVERVQFAKDIAAGLIDVAGYAAKVVDGDPLAAVASQRALDEVRDADLVLMCDVAHQPMTELPQGIDGSRVLRVITKCDLATPCIVDAIFTSALANTGIDALKAQIARRLRRLPSRGAALSAVLPRQAAAVAQARALLIEAAAAAEVEPRRTHWTRPEETASLLRAAIEALRPISGGFDADDVLGRVFARFCIGK